VLGAVFFISKKMHPKRNLFALDSAWVIIPLVIFFIMVQDGVIDRVDGLLYLLLMVSYLVFLFSDSKDDLGGEVDDELIKEKFKWGKTILLLTIGFALTIGGANFLVLVSGLLVSFLSLLEHPFLSLLFLLWL
jgi:cation:H+ antiporter